MNPTQQPFFDVRMRGFRERATVEAVLRLLHKHATPLPEEVISLALAARRVLSSEIVSPANVPGFDRAAMDGFAIRSGDTLQATANNPIPLSLVGESRPARPFVGTLNRGQTVRIMTGAPVPTGADAILVAEVAQVEAGDQVLIREPVSPGRHVGHIGEDVAIGRSVLPVGRLLRPQDLGLLASIGVGTVPVVRRPRVVVLVTGNELLPPGSAPEGYKIVDSNSPMLAALITRDGGECFPVQYLPDDYPAIRDALRAVSEVADVLLTSGGSSVGTEDHVPRIIAELGELAIHGISLRPAGPTGVGFLTSDRRAPVFLLPGNPVSCLCAYDLFAGRVVRRLGGHNWELPYRKTSLPLAGKIVSVVGRTDYVRVKVEEGQVTPIATSGGSILSTTVTADGFVLVAPEREAIAQGELVEVWLY